jgi:hypothetical protein
MNDPHLEEYMQTERYRKIECDTRSELDNALENLHSTDVSLRKQGAKRLSWNSRKELGWNCYPVRVWFLDRSNKEELFRCIESEPDVKIQSDLLRTLHFSYERYMLFWMWKKVVTETELQSYSSDLILLAEKFIENKSPDIRLEVAYILAMLEDGRAWDIYDDLLQKRASVAYWVRFAGEQYAEKSINRVQIEKLTATLGVISESTKNSSVIKDSKKAIELLLKIVK